jgi:hypothetical protein
MKAPSGLGLMDGVRAFVCGIIPVVRATLAGL